MTAPRPSAPTTVANFAVTGVGAGLLGQLAASSGGRPPLVPPASLPATLVVLGAAVLILAVLLRRAVTAEPRKPVNPFHAVRLLIAAKASLFAGALFAGLGFGMLLQFATRSVPPVPGIWVPVAATLGAGVALAVCGAIAEHLCRVPPAGDDPDADESGDHVDQPA